MAEYIEREAAIAMIRENGVLGSGWSNQECEDDVVDMIESITAADVRPVEWIPVTERLPEDGKFVLVCNDDGHMMIAKHETETYEWYYKYTNYDFDIWDNEEQGPVRYWMPLPEPPKEET